VVGVGESTDPRDGLAGSLEIEHTGQGSAVSGPASAVLQEEVCLFTAISSAAGEVLRMTSVNVRSSRREEDYAYVSAANKASVSSASVVAAERRILVGSTLSGLEKVLCQSGIMASLKLRA
jgi:hypothetical protein